jgi:dihydroorotate dehydrogenase electron transfer subunit
MKEVESSLALSDPAQGDHVAAGCASACGSERELAFPVAQNACRVVGNRWVNAEYRHLVVEAPPTALAARPGQFFHLHCPASGGASPFLRRPMSVYRVDRDNACVEFLYKVQGAGTRGLALLEPGDTLDAVGPVGRGFDVPEGARHVLLLARGVGLATLAPLARFAVARGARVTAVLSARDPSLVMSADYLRDAGADVTVVTDADNNSDVAHVESLLERIHAATPFDFVTTCGSNRLLMLLQRFADTHGIAGQIALEQHMGCALGACYACVRPFRKTATSDELTYRRVCWDGPVFGLKETVSW